MRMKIPMRTNVRIQPTMYAISSVSWKFSAVAGVRPDERTAVLQHEVADQRGEEAEEQAAELDERRPQLLVGRAHRLDRLRTAVGRRRRIRRIGHAAQSSGPVSRRRSRSVVRRAVELAIPVLQLLAAPDQRVERHLEVQRRAGR